MHSSQDSQTIVLCLGKILEHRHLAVNRIINTHPRHEIGFVLAQMRSPHSVPSLLDVLENPDEADMVRHEAAEALGEIAVPEVLPHLKEWMNWEDASRVVRESCQIAIDMWEVRYY